MKLYYYPPSPNTRKVLAVVEHLRLKVELQFVDLGKGEQLEEGYLALNPNHMTPTLEDGEFVLWESNAIMQYLAGGVPNNTLWPEDNRTRADINRWQCWQLAHWNPPCETLIWQRVVVPLLGLGEPDEALVASVQDGFHTFAKVLDGHLSGREWLVGDGPTLADFSVGAPLMYMETAGMPVQPYDSIKRWYEGLESLAAWQRSAPALP